MMRRSLALAQEGSWTCTPNPMVGCVIARHGEVIAEGRHMAAGGSHAEIEALERSQVDVAGADMYVTLEPCVHQGRTPPCVPALIHAGLRRIIIAMEDPDPRIQGRGVQALRDAGLIVEVGVLEEEAQWLNRGFSARVTRGIPWVRLKTASSMDGRIALADGTSKWITSSLARQAGHQLRAESCAILTCSGTALADNPHLTARVDGVTRQPLRVVIDGQLRCPPDLNMFAGKAIVVTRAGKPGVLGANIEILALPGPDERVDLLGLLKALATRWQVNHLLVEAGGGLVGALLEQNLVDEIVAFIAPKYFGSGKAVATFPALPSLAAARSFTLRDVSMVGVDAQLQMVRQR